MDHLILAATELGLGACWIATNNPVQARQVLCLPDEVTTVLFASLDTQLTSPKRKTASRFRSLSITNAGKPDGFSKYDCFPA